MVRRRVAWLQEGSGQLGMAYALITELVSVGHGRRDGKIPEASERQANANVQFWDEAVVPND
jgi:hypothetical protein